ncbi:SBBP repeat-containing protein [Dyadobacter sp.]|uniref:SBBP repeat-containing protein n=1 Tax=Dyadobacter sp. TaxID=1914288 RepID=UPI0025C6CB5E|nr:SBBP repeat-containing protein [Dyadobacter sp.]
MTGSFSATTTFGSITKTVAGNTDVFIAKYKPDGLLEWVETIGGTSYDEGHGIAVDANGNVYVTGHYYETISAGNFSVTSAGSADVFIAKYNTNGQAQWIRSAGSDGGERGYDLAIDNMANVYVTGEFQGTGFFGSIRKQSAGEFDLFVAKYDTNGEFLWVQSAGGSHRETGNGIATDPNSGDVYVTGTYFGTTTFGNTTRTSAGNADVFIAKYSKDGSFQWMLSNGGPDSDSGIGITTDRLGNIFVTGQHEVEANGFLNKYSSDGSLLWGTPLDMNSQGAGVATDQSGNTYVISNVSVLLKYGPDGSLQRAEFPRSDDFVIGTGVAVGSHGKPYLTGFYRGNLTFGGSSKIAAGVRDMFVIAHPL